MQPLLFLLAAILLAPSFVPKPKPKLPDEFVKVPAGTVRAERNDSTEQLTIQEFYISKFEVTNLQYRTFYEEIAPGLPEAEKLSLPVDEGGWSRIEQAASPLTEIYFTHPTYNNYPVVNITYTAAVKYCEWLQRKIAADNPAFSVEVKIPDRNQWMYAASGGRTQAMYPWGNFYLRNKQGEFLCNFRRVGDQAIVRNRETGKPEINEAVVDASLGLFTATVKSFYPNDFGLYNMCGNVAEMISQSNICVGGSWNDYGGDVHIRSKAFYGRSAATVGFRPIIIVKEK